MVDTPAVLFFDRLKCGNENQLIVWLQSKNLIPVTKICDCGKNMGIQKYTRSPDSYIFRCCYCKKTKSIREATYFDCKFSKLPLRKIVQLVFHWITGFPVTTAATLTDVNIETAVQWYSFYRDTCSFNLLHIEERLGNNDGIVEIDETLMFKRKNNIGRTLQQFWVFGLYDNNEKRGYLELVENREADTLIPIIQRWVLPGAIIHSDGWRAYNLLSSLGFRHFVVNHRENFVDPTTGACTNHVEAFWSTIKKKLKRVAGSSGEMRWAHLDEALYRHWHRFKAKNVLNDLDTFLNHAFIHHNA